MMYESFIRPLTEYFNVELLWIVLMATVANYLLMCLFYKRKVFSLGNIGKMLAAAVYVFVFLSVIPSVVANCSEALSTLFFALFLFGPAAASLLWAVWKHDETLFVR